MDKKFNIRVYGILINNQNEVLLSDELIGNMRVTKFPGGGLEFGEGTIECLKREFLEETGNQIKVLQHFYTTDYFQVSAFNPQHQIMSVYYLVTPLNDFNIETTNTIFDFKNNSGYEQKFRWLPLYQCNQDSLTLPIDKVVAGMLAKINGTLL
jgi:8-oxo-dGTP diphosphatase